MSEVGCASRTFRAKAATFCGPISAKSSMGTTVMPHSSLIMREEETGPRIPIWIVLNGSSRPSSTALLKGVPFQNCHPLPGPPMGTLSPRLCHARATERTLDPMVSWDSLVSDVSM